MRASDFAGDVVVLHFWATWCGACRGEMPEMAKAHAALSPRARFVMVAADGRGDGEKVRAVLRSHGVTAEAWLWANAGDMRHYGVGPGIPATVVIDRAGLVRARFQGATTAAAISAAVAPLVAPER